MDADKVIYATLTALVAALVWILKFMLTTQARNNKENTDKYTAALKELSDKQVAAIQACTHAINNMRLVIYVMAHTLAPDMELPDSPDPAHDKRY